MQFAPEAGGFITQLYLSLVLILYVILCETSVAIFLKLFVRFLRFKNTADITIGDLRGVV